MTAVSLQEEGSDRKIADAFWKWQKKLAKAGQHPVFVEPMLQRIQKVDPERLTKYLNLRLDEIEKADSTSQLVEFAERVSHLGETKVGRTRL